MRELLKLVVFGRVVARRLELPDTPAVNPPQRRCALTQPRDPTSSMTAWGAIERARFSPRIPPTARYSSNEAIGSLSRIMLSLPAVWPVMSCEQSEGRRDRLLPAVEDRSSSSCSKDLDRGDPHLPQPCSDRSRKTISG